MSESEPNIEVTLDLKDEIALHILDRLMEQNKFGCYQRWIEEGSDKKYLHYDDERFERIVRLSYKLANIVRKVRLSPFE